MPISLDNPTLPFDPTGTRESNLVTNEIQVLVRVAFRDFHFLVPKMAPFFAEGHALRYRDQSGVTRPLVEGVDYYLGHKFHDASLATAKDLYGSFSFLNTNLEGVIYMDYQSVGGIWTLDEQKLAEIVANELYNPRTVQWEEVADYPSQFPVIDHEWNLVDMVGMSEVVAALDGIREALLTSGDTGIAAHIADKENPHGVTKAQVGLSNVLNYAVATNAQMVAGTATNLYATAAGVKAAITAQALGPLSAHTSATGNVHGMVASDINVYDKPQVDQLLAGKLNTNGVVQDSLKFDGRTPVDYRDWVLTFTAANSERFAGRTYAEMLSDVLVGGVENAQKLNGRTDQETKDWVLEGTAANATALGNRNSDALKAWILQGTAADTSAFGGRDANAYKEFVLEGKAADATLFNGQTFQDLADTLGNLYAARAESAAQYYTGPYVSGTANSWTKIGQVLQNPSTASFQAPAHWLVTGGESTLAVASRSGYYVQVAVGGPLATDVKLIATSMVGDTVALRFGYTKNDTDGTWDIWVQAPKNRQALTVTEIAQGAGQLLEDDPGAQDTAPAGITYGTEDGFALRSDVEAMLDGLTTAFNALAATIQT